MARQDREKIDLGDAKTWQLVRRLLQEQVRPYSWHLAGAILFMGIVAGATAMTAWLLDPVVDKVFVDKDASMLWLVGGAVVATFIVKNVAAYIQEVLVGYVGQKVIADTQRRLYRHLLDQDAALFQDRHTGALLSHFTFDINAMRQAVSNALVGLGRDLLTVIFLVGVMFYQEWLLALIVVVVGPLSVWPIQVIGKRMRRVSKETQEEMGSLAAHLSQSFHGIRVIKAYGMEPYEEGRMGILVDKLFALTFRATRAKAAVQPMIDIMGGIAIAAVIIYGGAQVIEGVTTPGAFFSFIAAAIMAYQPLRALGKVNANLQEGLAAAQRIFALIDRKPTIQSPKGAKELPRKAAEVRLEDVNFTYDGDVAALDNLTLTAPAGKVTALVGPSGAGKTTVLSLIPRFFDVESGRITIDGTDLRTLSLESLRRAIALVSQEVVLFDDTVMANIRYGRPDATDAEVEAAAEAAAAHDFIRNLPDGYETVVGEHGLKLSGGQRQRIAIARAILKDAPILLLDEATSALDTEAERQIQTALGRLMKGRTTLVIAHRLSTIRQADVIHVMDRGKLIESGDHQSLIAKEGLYAHLHQLQFVA